jgi:[acyl-carrier-protein] S-malonyltransferase
LPHKHIPVVYLVLAVVIVVYTEIALQAYHGIVFASGYSLGEITAVVASGALSLRDGVKVVRSVAEASQRGFELTPSTMSSISGLDDNRILELCNESRNDGEILHISNFLFPLRRVVSGHLASVEKFEKTAIKAGAKNVKRLNVSGAFHSSLLEPTMAGYKKTLSEVTFHPPKFPVYSNLTGLPYESDVDMVEMLCRQICEPALWEQSVKHMLKTFALTSLYELGPKRQLRTILERIDPVAAAKLAKNIEA